jgi:hypothetical protein
MVDTLICPVTVLVYFVLTLFVLSHVGSSFASTYAQEQLLDKLQYPPLSDIILDNVWWSQVMDDLDDSGQFYPM